MQKPTKTGANTSRKAGADEKKKKRLPLLRGYCQNTCLLRQTIILPKQYIHEYIIYYIYIHIKTYHTLCTH